MDYNIMSDTGIEIDEENGNNEDEGKECIICFEGSSKENILKPISTFYIMPDCSCEYDVHAKCIEEWKHIQQQQRNNYQMQRRGLYCLKCNSRVVTRGIWKREDNDNVRRNNYNAVCIIIASITGLVIIMFIVGIMINNP